MKSYNSWGRLNYAKAAKIICPDTKLNFLQYTDTKILTFGKGRSYGDVNQNSEGTIIDNSYHNRFIGFDREKGILTAQSGVTLEQVLDLVVPQGWFLSVTPGTRYVTLGGALANDVHGKNHHKVGSFGTFVEAFELCRSDGSRIICSKTQNSEYFYATIGGLGLTGWVNWIQIKLTPIQNDNMVVSSIKFTNLDEYFELNQKLEQEYTYTVAWIDCLASGKSLGRGIYFAAEHSPTNDDLVAKSKKSRNFIFNPSFSLVNKLTLKTFNWMYYHKSYPSLPKLQHYLPYFYPLDGINNWNRMYGKSGFYQYQCVIPYTNAKQNITEILKTIEQSGSGSFLAVLKTFGEIHSGGLLSFPRRGVTLALDFPNQGKNTKELFSKLDQIVYSAEGALYPAKDAMMDARMFRQSYPKLDEFIKYKDPKFNSNFWNRVTGQR